MVLTIHMHLVLVAATFLLLFARQVTPTPTPSTSTSQLTFSACVGGCVETTDCDNKKCICKKAAREKLLETVLTCMFQNCPKELRKADTFLDIIQSGCKAIKRPIPDDDIEDAEAVASSLVSQLPAPSTSTAKGLPSSSHVPSSSSSSSSPPKTTAKPLPATTSHSAPAASTSSKTIVSSSSSASSSSSSAAQTSTSLTTVSSSSEQAETITSARELPTTTTLAAQSSSSSSSEAPKTSAAVAASVNCRQTDSSPYATTPAACSSGFRSSAFVYWVTLTSAVGVAVLLR